MKYVKPSLHLLKLDGFDYPRLTAYKYTEDYGFDRVEYASVFFNEMFAGRATNHFVFQEHADRVDFAEIQSEVAEFNKNLKANWDEVILGLLEKQASDTMEQIMSRVESLKVIRQNMEKFTTGKG